MAFEERLGEIAALVENRLAALLGQDALGATPPVLGAAMRHAVLGGGKRFRPFLVIEGARVLGMSDMAAVDTACAVECLHCYSLVHDDLPAMDNDELRRGQPTVWKAFDEATGILAGDALLTFAFELLARPSTHADAAVRAALVLGLAEAGGSAGMVGGQVLDLASEKGDATALHTLDGVSTIQRMKTGALIRFSAEAGAILVGAAPDERRALRVYGKALGAAFQIADDLLDAEGDASATGKAVGKDAAAGKATFVTVLGIAGARKRLAELNAEARAALAPFGEGAHHLAAAIDFVSNRRG
ncbi:polyprenyl synthetase family protein [Hyphomicrobium sp. CS1BSMeth3]|uniref:polyprenyl synthetase family protein n=1 Tax=Hyphomicrobium sp. CS1BSMeth3 TaxID=1892844 RepID=UPI000931F632|nr:farnesyl diphosphate synthase [Hyphomicrobium sp. CS1BSMeth3]